MKVEEEEKDDEWDAKKAAWGLKGARREGGGGGGQATCDSPRQNLRQQELWLLQPLGAEGGEGSDA